MDFQNQIFYKILNKELKHNGFQYNLRLTIDTVPFNPSGSCEPGGLYFTTFDHIFKFIDYGNNIAEISIPEDAKVYGYPGDDRYKADRIFIKNIETLENFFDKNPEFLMIAVKQNGRVLKYVKNQTPELCMEAVKNYGHALEFVQKQTPEICMEAVKENGYALQYVWNQTPELCLAAVKQNGCALHYVKNQTPKLCMEAVKQDGCALEYVQNQTPEICNASKQN